MRTTIDIDDYLLRQLRQKAHDEGLPLKEVLNRVIHRGLEQPRPKARQPYRCPTFSMGAPLRPLDKALALADALEDEERARKLRMRRSRSSMGG